jgi:hypothetical protein
MAITGVLTSHPGIKDTCFFSQSITSKGGLYVLRKVLHV